MKILATKTVYQSKFFQVNQNTIERDGKTFTKDFIKRNPTVLVIPYTEDNQIYMEKQFRDARNDYCLEVVSGNMDTASSPLENAKRELAEEIGLKAKTWKQIATWELSVSMDAKMYLFAATDLEETETNLDMDEEIESVKMPLRDVVAKIDSGEMYCASHIAAILLFKKMREEGKL